MNLSRFSRPLMIAAGMVFLAFPAKTQVTESEQERVRAMAEEISSMMAALETRATGYPQFIADLQAGLVTIEQADEQVQQLITELTTATDKMEDGGDLDTSIDAYRTATSALIAEAEASNNDAIKSSIPDLQKTLTNLGTSDESRVSTVIEARNLIRSLEQNRDAIAFFIKADQVQRASNLIAANVTEFSGIVGKGKALAAGLIGGANP